MFLCTWWRSFQSENIASGATMTGFEPAYTRGDQSSCTKSAFTIESHQIGSVSSLLYYKIKKLLASQELFSTIWIACDFLRVEA